MSEVIIAENTGFCLGVKRAVETAKKISGKGVYILGELIHNKFVVDEITSKGTKIINDVSEIDSGTLIIRSHGVGKDILDNLKNNPKIKVINCTCPFVVKIHKIVESHYNNGYKIVIIGQENHPETIGINGWCNYSAQFVTNDNQEIIFNDNEKVCVVCQTTYDRTKFEKILDKINKNHIKTLEIFDTICYTTKENQTQANELSKKCDAMVVIGGKNSSNTSKLRDICIKNCKNVFYIENVAELDIKKVNKFKRIGVVCGASTPVEQAKEVLVRMSTDVKVEDVMSMDEAMKVMPEQTKFKRFQEITAIISSATEEGLMILLPNTKKEILLKKEEIDCETFNKEDYSKMVGDDIKLIIIDLNPVVVSQKMIKKLEEEAKEIEEIKNGKVFQVVVSSANKGGLIGKYGSYSVFIPSSQIKLNGFAKDLEKYVGKTLRVKAEEGKVETKPRRKQIVASQKVVLQEEKAIKDKEREEKENAFLNSIEVNEIVTGTVVRIAPFAAFVNINGFDCFAHISDLSWTPIKTPADVLEINKAYDFVILKIDRDAKKVSIGYKQLQPKPWDTVPEKYAEGDVITGKVVRVVDFGAFIEVDKGIDGLVHVSQISHEFLENPATVLTVGQEVQAKIMSINLEKEKMTLSIKEVLPAPVKEEKAEVAEEEKPAKPKKVKKEKIESDEIRGWKEDKDGGASIFELINQDNK